MILMVGLGNPGPKHQHNRHNIGFMAIDAIQRQHGFGAEKTRFQGICAEGVLQTRSGAFKTLALRPTTYMNESGRSVGEAVRFYKLDPESVIVFYDEIDLEPAKIRVKNSGGIAGHNGLRSLRDHIGPDFKRVRIGVGHPGQKDMVYRHVLSDFSKADRQWVEPLIEAIARHAPLLADGDDATFMNRVVLDTRPPENADAETTTKT